MNVLRVYRFCEYTLNCVIPFTNITVVTGGNRTNTNRLSGVRCGKSSKTRGFSWLLRQADYQSAALSKVARKSLENRDVAGRRFSSFLLYAPRSWETGYQPGVTNLPAQRQAQTKSHQPGIFANCCPTKKSSQAAKKQMSCSTSECLTMWKTSVNRQVGGFSASQPRRGQSR